MAVKIIAFVSTKPGQEDAFIAAAQTCAAASRAEPGVIYYQVWRETEGERRFVFNELYVDAAAVAAHMASDHFKAFGRAAAGFAAAPPVIISCEAVDIG
jgi:quinol monooxygenase YgiN